MPKRKRLEENDGDDARRRKWMRAKTTTSRPCNAPSSGNVHHAVLSQYFPRVVSLRTFISARLPRSKQRQLASLDLALDRGQDDNFLDQILVGLLDEAGDNLSEARHEDFVKFTQDIRRSAETVEGSALEHHMEEIVDYVIWTTFQKQAASSFRPKHLLCHGYQKAIVRNIEQHAPTKVSRIQGLFLEQTNENVRMLKQQPWIELLSILGKFGDRIMHALLLDCGIFLPLSEGKGNYYQLSGIPISDMSALKAKPMQSNTKNTSKASKALSANNVTFGRHRILYAKPSLNSQRGIRFNLKHNHVLNHCRDSRDMEEDINLMKKIFPRQFGLPNVFCSHPDMKSNVSNGRDHTLREKSAPSLLKRERLPRRLRGLPQELVNKIQRNYKQCPYAQLLRHHTSRSISLNPKSDASAPTLSGESISKTQTSSCTAGSKITNTSSSPLSAKVTGGPLMQFATPVIQVSNFCQAVLCHLLPRNAFGSGMEGEANKQAVMRSIARFVYMRRNELLHLHTIIQGIKIKSIPWLVPPKLSNLKMSASDRYKRMEIFTDFITFVFESLLIPLIRASFYVTESGVHRSRLFYFRHDVWRKISEPSLAQLKLTMLQEINHNTSENTLGYSTVRLLPKLNGVRMIANLKKKILKNFRGSMVLSNGINKNLEPLFDVLRYERARQPLKIGSSIFSSNEIHGRLKNFKQRWNGQRLYFVKLDIKSCFDSIPQDYLSEYAESLIQEDQYQVHTHSAIKASDELKISCRFPHRVITENEDASFSFDIASKLAVDRKRTIFADTGNRKMHRSRTLLPTLREHVTSNTVKIGKSYYRQMNGIPQGSILSSLLCSFFYGAFEAENLSFLDDRSLLIRLIDDFLLITTEPTAARRFLDVMSSGDLKYGISVQASKSLTNFDATVKGRKIPRLHGTTAFPYIGLTVDTLTLSVSKGRVSKDPEVQNGLTVQNRQAGRGFRNKVLHSLKIQILALVLDTQLNSKVKVLTSLYECFAEMAMKMCRYMDAMLVRPHAGLVISVLQESLTLTFNLMRRPSTIREKVTYRCDISRPQTEWTAAVAVRTVLMRKQSRYGDVLRWLEDLKHTWEVKTKIDEKTRQLVVKEGSRGLMNYVF